MEEVEKRGEGVRVKVKSQRGEKQMTGVEFMEGETAHAGLYKPNMDFPGLDHAHPLTKPNTTCVKVLDSKALSWCLCADQKLVRTLIWA